MLLFLRFYSIKTHIIGWSKLQIFV